MPDYLDDVLDRMSPPAAADDAVLDRAYARLSDRMARPSMAAHRRTFVAGLAAAVALSGVAYATTTGHSGSTQTASQTLIKLAGYMRDNNQLSGSKYVKIVSKLSQTTAKSCPDDSPQDTCANPGPHTAKYVDVTIRPSDLADTTTEWVTWTEPDGAIGGIARSGKCEAFDLPPDPCAATTKDDPTGWRNLTPVFLASLANQPVATAAASLMTYLRQGKASGSVRLEAEFWANDALQRAAMDPAAMSAIVKVLAEVAKTDGTGINVTQKGAVFEITSPGSTFSYDTDKNELTLTDSSVVGSRMVTISASAASADDLSSVPTTTTPDPNRSGTPFPTASPSTSN